MVAVDRPEVLRVARMLAEAMGVLDRVQLFEGDLFEVGIGPESFDAALFANIMRAKDEEPGDEVWNQIEMLTMAPAGTLYTADRYRQMAVSAGLVDIERHSTNWMSARKTVVVA